MKVQRANPNHWLYQEDKDGTRNFALEIFLPNSAEEWQECTNEEKELYDAEHPIDESLIEQ